MKKSEGNPHSYPPLRGKRNNDRNVSVVRAWTLFTHAQRSFHISATNTAQWPLKRHFFVCTGWFFLKIRRLFPQARSQSFPHTSPGRLSPPSSEGESDLSVCVPRPSLSNIDSSVFLAASTLVSLATFSITCRTCSPIIRKASRNLPSSTDVSAASCCCSSKMRCCSFHHQVVRSFFVLPRKLFLFYQHFNTPPHPLFRHPKIREYSDHHPPPPLPSSSASAGCIHQVSTLPVPPLHPQYRLVRFVHEDHLPREAAFIPTPVEHVIASFRYTVVFPSAFVYSFKPIHSVPDSKVLISNNSAMLARLNRSAWNPKCKYSLKCSCSPAIFLSEMSANIGRHPFTIPCWPK